MLNLLYRSFDEPLTDTERLQLNEALEASNELRAMQKELEGIRSALSSMQVKSFKPLLAERVWQRIQTGTEQGKTEELFWESLMFVFRRIAVAAIVALLIILSYNLINYQAQPSEEITFEEFVESDFFFAME
jgi:hypothetical protein